LPDVLAGRLGTVAFKFLQCADVWGVRLDPPAGDKTSCLLIGCFGYELGSVS